MMRPTGVALSIVCLLFQIMLPAWCAKLSQAEAHRRLQPLVKTIEHASLQGDQAYHPQRLHIHLVQSGIQDPALLASTVQWFLSYWEKAKDSFYQPHSHVLKSAWERIETTGFGTSEELDYLEKGTEVWQGRDQSIRQALDSRLDHAVQDTLAKQHLTRCIGPDCSAAEARLFVSKNVMPGLEDMINRLIAEQVFGTFTDPTHPVLQQSDLADAKKTKENNRSKAIQAGLKQEKDRLTQDYNTKKKTYQALTTQIENWEQQLKTMMHSNSQVPTILTEEPETRQLKQAIQALEEEILLASKQGLDIDNLQRFEQLDQLQTRLQALGLKSSKPSDTSSEPAQQLHQQITDAQLKKNRLEAELKRVQEQLLALDHALPKE